MEETFVAGSVIEVRGFGLSLNAAPACIDARLRKSVKTSMRSPTGSCQPVPVSARSLAAQDRRRYLAAERA